MMPLQSFAIFGGVYAFASCIAQRIRQKQDGELSTARIVHDRTLAMIAADAMIRMLPGSHAHPVIAGINMSHMLCSFQWRHSGVCNRAGTRVER